MATPGLFHTLKVTDVQAQGHYLDDGEGGRILLPKRYVPEGTEPGDELNVFVYLDSDDRIIATTQRPRVQLHQAACLDVKDVNKTGAFLDWGLPKDLFVPFAEQKQKMEAGKQYVVYVTEDNTGRLIGSARLNRFIRDEAKSEWPGAPAPFETGDKVKLLIAQRTDIGYKAIVNDKFWGVLHDSQIHKAIRVGQRMEGFVRRLREDHRLDLSLEPIGHKRTDPLAGRILKKLGESNGTLGLNDYSPAELIEMHFGVSKRAFKMAIGKLFKERKIVIEENGIRLATEQEQAAGTKKTNSAKHGDKKNLQRKPDQKRAEKVNSKTAGTDTPDTKANVWSAKAGKNSDAGKPQKTSVRSKASDHSKTKPAQQDKAAKSDKPAAASKKTVYRNPKTKTESTLRLKK
ncbi:MAG: S1-like domain-containing RNA-binding protein [Thalassolituus sp.]